MPVTIQEKLSWVPFKIDLRYEDVDFGIGTAFIYSMNNETFLITNYHNVTGRRPDTLRAISPDVALPNKLVLHVPKDANTDTGLPKNESKVGWNALILDLYEDDKPVWFEHPEHGHNVDAVAIPIGIDDCMLQAANSEELELDQITLRPSLDVFVLGYPRGLSGGAKLPIWKRGSIASEPDIDLDKLPKFYIDTATREGMSGSPVYAQHNGYCVPEGSTGPQDALFGEARRFAGIYSGRVGTDDFQAQLGIVWKESAIQEIIVGKHIGKSSFLI